MKTLCNFASLVLFSVILSATVQANTLQERHYKAERYYQQGEFKKAYKSYFKMAKAGDHYSQYRVSQMHVSGEGTKRDLVDAYAWAVLANESGDDEIKVDPQALLLQVEDKTEAQREAEKLKKKYGTQALQKKSARSGHKTNSGSCTGSRIACLST